MSIWCNEEDHLRVTVLCHTALLNEPFDLLAHTLKQLESIENVVFARSDEYGYVTSCPSNLGTGMRASVHVRFPNLTKDGTTDKASEIGKKYGMSVRGTGGEHTPVVNNTVDLSPSARFGIPEATVLKMLHAGIKAMMEEENKLGGGVSNNIVAICRVLQKGLRLAGRLADYISGSLVEWPGLLSCVPGPCDVACRLIDCLAGVLARTVWEI